MNKLIVLYAILLTTTAVNAFWPFTKKKVEPKKETTECVKNTPVSKELSIEKK